MKRRIDGKNKLISQLSEVFCKFANHGRFGENAHTLAGLVHQQSVKSSSRSRSSLQVNINILGPFRKFGSLSEVGAANEVQFSICHFLSLSIVLQLLLVHRFAWPPVDYNMWPTRTTDNHFLWGQLRE